MSPITNFSNGTTVNILNVMGRPDLVHRMEAMGVVPGKEIKVLRVQGKAVVLQSGHTRLAIRTSAHLHDVTQLGRRPRSQISNVELHGSPIFLNFGILYFYAF